MNRRGIDEIILEMRFEIVYSKNYSRRKGFLFIFEKFKFFENYSIGRKRF